MDLKRDAVEAYLRSLAGEDAELVGMRTLGETIPTTEDVKGFGYGSPVLLEYRSKEKAMSAV
ncbi:MAG: aminoglycoside phosphotransferase family protein, partial [Methanothrix sp.]|nr:aminoglycoside phosphotransferase family protein [Methanothrix sp.]